MTIADLAPVIEYLEDGVSLNFPVPFRFLVPEDLTAWRDLGGAATTLAYGADYYATGGETDGGGTLVLLATVAGAVLHIERHTPLSQDADYQTNDRFPAETHEGVLDKLMAIAQEQDSGLADISARALRVPPGEVIPPFPSAALRAQSIAGFDGLGNPALFPADVLGSIAVIAQRVEYEAVAGQTAFPTFAPYVIGFVSVFVNGVKLSNSEFTATDGTTVVLGEPAAGGDIVSLEAFLGSSLAGDAAGISFIQRGAGARVRPAQDKMREAVSIDDFTGCDPTGATDSTAAFVAALAVGDEVRGVEGSTYLIAGTVTVASNKKLVGNGATIKGAAGLTAFHFTGNNNAARGWNVAAAGALYIFRNDGQRNSFTDNIFFGNVGHYIFCPGALFTLVANNKFECESDSNVTTCVVFENCQHFICTGNTFNGVPVGWGVQARASSQSGVIANNTFRQFRYSHPITATAGQTVFNFTLPSVVNFKGIQINGKPLSKGYTFTGSGPSYTATFAAGRTAGEVVTLVGFRGAENIQLNTSAFDIAVANNIINGTGDSGIVCLADRVSITGNIIKNAAYAGIALYGGQNNITVTGNTVSDCAMLDDGQSSPDNPAFASVFNGGILVSGSQISVTGNTIINDAGTMAYGVRLNTTDNVEDGATDKAVKLGNNSFRGTFALGKYCLLQDTAGKRVQSVEITDGMISQYPERVNLDGAWTNAPVATPYFTYGGFGGTFGIRDTAVKLGGVASLKTVAGEYVDITPTANAIFRDCILKLSFWAKNNSGQSYCSLFSDLGGGLVPVTVNITDTNWRQYTMMVPLTANLASMGLTRIGANSGNANFQHIEFSMIRI